MSKDLKKAVEVIRQGGIVIFPTDTAFGIGCRIDSKKAVERLFKIRKRPRNQAMPVLVNGLEMARMYGKEISPKVMDKLIQPYWPGALTIVVECEIDKVFELVRGGGNTIGLRMPDNEAVLKIISQVGVPVLGPSANFHGESTPFSIKDLNPKLVGQVDYVLDGECILKKASTVIDVTMRPWQILRQGALNITIDL